MLARSGSRDLAELIQTLFPAFQASFPAVAGGAEHLRPYALYGLGADQVLVLVNGQRRLQSPWLPLADITGRGEALADLNTIPIAALERIEIRRAAAAWHGDGAVAGVINLVLADSLVTALRGSVGVAEGGDAAGGWAEGSHSVSLGRGGRAALAAEAGYRGPSNAAGPDLRAQYFPGDPRNGNPARVTHRFGEPGFAEARASLLLERPLGRGIAGYGHAAWSRRQGESGELFRRPADDRTVRALFPDGYLPLLRPRFQEASALGGLRGGLLGDRLHWDAWIGYARSSVRLDVAQTVNASLGPPSPTRFHSGTLRADQFSAGFELAGRGRAGPVPLSAVAGATHRSEGFEQRPGEPDSYRYGAVPVQDGPNAGGVTEPGAQGLPGFRPEEAVVARRGTLSGYGLLRAEPISRVTLEAAGRLVYFQASGTTASYETGLRLEPLRGLELHGSAGTGVRAPALAQTHFSATRTDVSQGFGLEEQTVPLRGPLAAAIGAAPLRLERSRHWIAGGRLSFGALRAGFDYFRIRVRDRISLTGWLADPDVADLLASRGFPGVGAVRYYRNALTTVTSTWTASAGYTVALARGSLALRAVWEHAATAITAVDSLEGLLAQFSGTAFGRVEQALIETARPENNALFAAQFARGAWQTGLRVRWYGAITVRGAAADSSLDQRYGARGTADLRADYRLRPELLLAAGVDNLLGSRPERNRAGDADTEGNSYFGMFPYPASSPFGFRGRFLYLRAEWRY
jgi:iron complex outermembrane receptor protein